MGRQSFTARNPPGRQVYLYLHRPILLRTAGASPRLDQRRRRKPPTDPLLPLRPHRHPERDDEGAKILDSVTNIEDVDGKETACPGGVLVKSNEQGAKGIGRNLIDKLNAHIVKIETGMRRR